MNAFFKNLKSCFFLFMVIVAQSCGSDNDEAIDDPAKNSTDIAVTGLVEECGCTYVRISGYANLNLLPPGSGNPEIGIEICLADSEYGYSDEETTIDLSGNRFIVEFSKLSAGTKYMYRSFVEYGGLKHYGKYRTFITKDLINITSTGEVTDVTHTSVLINSNFQKEILDSKEFVYVGVAFSTDKSALHPDSIFHKKKISIHEAIHEANSYQKDSYSISLNDLLDGTTYYYASFTSDIDFYYSMYTGVGVKCQYCFSEIKEFTTKKYPIIQSGAVDLGLSVKWAACNVDASSPIKSGGSYAWGETEEKTIYNWSTYKWANGSYDSIIKYCINSEYGIIDEKKVLDLEDDAAHVKWGGNWRMPTLGEALELYNNCSLEVITYKGVGGVLVTGVNGNCIFFPEGRYWTSSLGKHFSAFFGFFAEQQYIYSGDENFGRWTGRSSGFLVRPVAE